MPRSPGLSLTPWPCSTPETDNGAVVSLGGRTILLADGFDERMIARLDDIGPAAGSGQSIIAVPTGMEAAVLNEIASHGPGVALHRNRGTSN